MAFCPKCGVPIPDTSRFCPACGSQLVDSSQTPTEFVQARIVESRSPRTAFTPGQVVAQRYRIVGLLGRGGMGEVYRADDLKLGQPVALKFLPREIERDPAALERLHAEVRNARQVSHPHVCRVYDIGDVDGRHFLTMEYVDGEDLGTLLRRIGRLPPAKAVEISRQLCAGLAAAHEQGVLHRDLKPANIMIDGHGRARITDFGVAVPRDEATAEIAGTPAYMAPEVHSGSAATVQSDLYSLGLVLYEIFTGKRAFDATILSEWRRVHTEDAPTSPSIHTADIDPAAERVILRCLEKNPAQRPRSASQLAMALPGGDPLAAAIAAGETPSPEMVAAAGGEGGLTPALAWTVLAAFFALLIALAFITPYSTDLGLAPMEMSPDGMYDHAKAIVARLGYPDRPADETHWLERDYDPLRWLADHQDSTEWRSHLHELGPPVLLHYRRSPEPLVASNARSLVRDNDPAANQPGMINVRVDGRGRLRDFLAVPPHWSDPLQPAGTFPDDAVFDLTGLDPERFRSVDSEWVPLVPFDERREWTGTRAEAPELDLRLGAAVFAGRIVAIAIHGPWSARDSTDPLAGSASRRIGAATLAVVLLCLSGSGVYFARRNLRLGRGDRKGAIRVAWTCALLVPPSWILTAHLTSQVSELVFEQVFPMVADAVMTGLIIWVMYVAVEPYLRRKLPELLVGWARVLEGRFRDPRVGRDILLGVTLGAAVGVLFHIANGLPTILPFLHQTPAPSFRTEVEGRLAPLASLLEIPVSAVGRAFLPLFLLFVVRLFTRRSWIAFVAIWGVFSLISLGAENPMLEIPAAILSTLLMTIAITRFGLLAATSLWLSALTTFEIHIRPDVAHWGTPYSVAAIGLLVGLAIWAFRTSLGGRPVFGSAALDA